MDAKFDLSENLIPVNNTLISQLILFSKFGSIFLILLGLVVIIGWTIEIAVLKSVIPGLTAMNPLTATAFTFSGICLLLQARNINTPISPLKTTTSVILAGFVLMVGFVTVLGYLFKFNLGVDQFMFQSSLGGNRIAVNTGFNFLLIGIALVLLSAPFQFRKKIHFMQILTLVTLLISLFAVFGYVFNALTLYKFSTSIPMALNTAIAFLILCISILATTSNRGLLTILTLDSLSSTLARRLLIVAFIIPPILGYLRLLGEQRGLYSVTLGTALMSISLIILLVITIWINIKFIFRFELQDFILQSELKKNNINLVVNAQDLATKVSQLEEQKQEVVSKLDTREKLIDFISTTN